MRTYTTLAILFLAAFYCSTATHAQTITTFAGGGSTLGDGGPATVAQTLLPYAGSFDGAGNYYFNAAARIRKVNPVGIVNTVVGNGTSGDSGDGGPATAAEIIGLNSDSKVDSAGNIYIASYDDYRLRKVDAATGIINTIAGNGTPTHTGDGGPATAATLTPGDVCIDKYGNLYVEDSARIRKIDTAGIITTIAGTGIGGFSGDGGPATAAEIVTTIDMTIGIDGNLYFGDMGGVYIRKIDLSMGIIITVAGTGNYLYNGDGIHADSAQFKEFGMAFDAIGNLFIADGGNQRIRMIDTSGIIHTVAGTGVAGYSGDGGAATAAQIYDPEGIAVDVCGNVYIADEANNRIRKVTMPPILTIPTISLSGISNAAVGNLVTVTATVTNAGSSYNIEWYNHGIEFTTTTIPYVTYTKPAGIDTITAKVVSTATYGCYDSTTSAGWVVAGETTAVSNVQMSEYGDVEIYPNPVSSVVHINLTPGATLVPYVNSEGEGDVTYRIMSMVGIVMQQGTLQQGSNSISVQALPAGVYIVEVTLRQAQDDKGLRITKKIVKQ